MPNFSAIITPNKRPNAKKRLLIFHHACGSSSVYYKWAKLFPEHIEVWLIDFPGRGRVTHLPPARRLTELRQFMMRLAPELDRPWSAFGHSMGAIVAYCVAADLETVGKPPLWLGLSGANAPFWPLPPARHLNQRDDKEILDYLQSLGQTHEALLADSQMKNHILRLARADFEILETGLPLDAAIIINTPITVFAGRSDSLVSQAGLEAWNQVTTATAQHIRLPGGHFYHFDRNSPIHKFISDAIDSQFS